MQNSNDTAAAAIAVLPFEMFPGPSESGAPDHAYFCRGFVEEVITDLAHFSNLQVISSYTARKIEQTDADELTIARNLGIDYLLKGHLRYGANGLRIATQLIDTIAGRILWAERYEAPETAVFEIQDDMVARVAGAISAHIDRALLAAARNKPLTDLATYDCWLRGMDALREGTPAADRTARRYFEQAVSLDANYSRAYAGLSLTYFNDWSCQIWEQWAQMEAKAYEYALAAERLDDTDHLVQMILGRILLYRRQYDLAEHHLDRSLTLNSNDADALAQISTSLGFLGKAGQGEQLFRKALRLNPYRNLWYYPYGAFTRFVQEDHAGCVDLALKGPLTEVWIDLPAFIAACYAYMRQPEQAAHYLSLFVNVFTEKITAGSTPRPDEMIDWLATANPFKREEDLRHLIDGVKLAGLRGAGEIKTPAAAPAPESIRPPAANLFRKSGDLWQFGFDGDTAQLPEVKGFHDLARLLAVAGEQIHCTELMGSAISFGDETLMLDDRARTAYKTRIADLQAQIAEAESMNDTMRAGGLQQEMDQLVDHLSRALGLGGRTRKLNTPVERARSAVTWRIRTAIRKIESVHPALGRHLANSVRTGTFCSYTPEQAVDWVL